jgi:large subunit ribosomal protein L25
LLALSRETSAEAECSGGIMKLEAQRRDGGKAAALRAEGKLPAIIYNRETNVPVTVDYKTFDRVFREQGTSSLIDVVVDGETHPVLVKAIQMDKRKRVPMHVDFYAITAGQVVEVYVPIEFLGEPAGAKEGGQVDVQRREVHIRILPSLIPGHIEVDVSMLEMGDSLHMADIASLLPAEAELIDDLDRTVIAVLAPRAEIEEEVEEVEVLEPELIAREGEEGEFEEGEAPEESEEEEE